MIGKLRKWMACLGYVLLLSMAGSSAAADKPSQQELDTMLAPIALYPDALLSQILMASTYPDQVQDAAKWSKANPEQKGDGAVTAVQDKGWDPSVSSLVAFPQVLEMAANKPEWVQQLGDAFLVAPEDVMDTVQSLRRKAQDAGNLKSSDQQKVVVDSSDNTTVIVIEASDPKVVYVPTYNPTVVYGSWWWPAYPPYYYYPPGYAMGPLWSGIWFGVGIGITNALWGDCNWRRGDVNINVNRFNNININNRINTGDRVSSWKQTNNDRRNNYVTDRSNKAVIDKRKDYRGRDAQRNKAEAALKDRGFDQSRQPRKDVEAGGRQRDLPKGGDRDGRDSLSRDASAPNRSDRMRDEGAGRDGAKAPDRQSRKADNRDVFDGIGSPGGERRSMDRGARSINSGGGRAGGRAGGHIGGRR